MFNRNVIVVGLCTLMLVACGGGDEAAAKKAVLGKLKDPDSAKFGAFSMTKHENPKAKQAACLTVNAKNSMGGYTGDKQAMMYREKPEEPWQVFDIKGGISQEMCLQLLTELGG
jgi:hypothetical protein